MFKILTLNNIAVAGLRRLPRQFYEVASATAFREILTYRYRACNRRGFLPTDPAAWTGGGISPDARNSPAGAS